MLRSDEPSTLFFLALYTISASNLSPPVWLHISMRVEARELSRAGFVSNFLARIVLVGCLLLATASLAKANVTVLLEEPYSYDGAFAGTGHIAIYLSRVCAASPNVLRRCLPGERGAVISRYTRIAGYDWLAIPLIPYLYAVENPEDIPLYADPKLVAFLRDRYRRSHLESIAPDSASGEIPKGDWVQLIGSSYDRASYGFQLETTTAQDDAMIKWLNSRPNRANYNAVSRNCANFVRDVVNFYYPGAISRGFITDLGVTTPKHAAKSLVKYTEHHSDVGLTRIVFPQIPGTMKRSKPVRGVLESLFRAKKYMLPLAAFHPIVAGSVASIYFFGDRFNPARNALVFNVDGDPEAPLPPEERKAYSRNLAFDSPTNLDGQASRDASVWKQFQQQAEFGAEDSGHLTATGRVGGDNIEIGISREGLMSSDVPELQRGLLLARFHQVLSRGRAPKISSTQLREDWRLWQEVNRVAHEEASGPLAGGN